MAQELAQDFKEFLNLLRVNQVEYLLIGAYAVGYHGYPRATQDLGVWIASTPQNATRLVAVLHEFGFGMAEVTPEFVLRPNNIIRMGREPVRIEILNWASGVDFDECYRERVVDEVDGVEVSLIGLDQLRKNKKAAGRHKDLADLEELS
jgi:predicted nucleotidyltransferase